MSNYLLLLVCFFAGIILKYTKKIPQDGHHTLNALIIYLAWPALILKYVHGIRFESALLSAVAMPWLVFVMGVVFFYAASKWMKFDKATTAALMLTGGLGSTSFIGIPMLESLLGPESVPFTVLIDQLGTYLTLSVLGILVIGIYTGEKPSVGVVLERLYTFPPFIALVLALVLYAVPFPVWLSQTLGRLGDTISPLALLSVGMQINLSALAANGKALTVGLVYKLLLAPIFVALLYVGSGLSSGTLGHSILLEAAMAPMIGAGIIASQNKFNPPLVALMLGIGIPLSFVTVPLFHKIFTMMGI